MTAVPLKHSVNMSWKKDPVTLTDFVAVIVFHIDDYNNGYKFVNRETALVLSVLKKCHRKFSGIVCEKIIA